VLGRPLHHLPTKGGPSEHARHVEQYERTLVTYAHWFGESPPADIWPPADVRFAKEAQHVRVNRRSAWIVRKPHWPRHATSRKSLVIGAFATPLLVGVVDPFNMEGLQFLKFYGMLCVVAILVAIALRRLLRSDAPVRDDEPLSPYEVACLGGGLPGVMRACLASLIVNQQLKLQPHSARKFPKTKPNLCSFSATTPWSANNELEQSMLRIASHENGATSEELLIAARPAAEEIQSELQRRGLVESAESFAAARWGPVLLLGIVWLAGLAKLLIGINRDKPVLFLLLGLVALLFVISMMLRIPLRTRRGDERLRELKDEHRRLQYLDISSGYGAFAPVASGDLMLAAGLFGLAALHHPDVNMLEKSLKPVSSDYASGGCGGGGGGCGGGGCGGGGCGGCGGGGD
jgi:uncharacterized protein (TIGR04222 family)